MAQKRMFSLQIVDTDAFLEMPVSSQLLYFHLVMRADDEGFIGNPKKIMRLVGVQEDDLKILMAKRFILTFESGVIVVKHWLIHNTIRMDRFNETTYQDEKSKLKLNENKSYTELQGAWQPSGNQMEPQVKLSKVNLSEVKLERGDKSPTPADKAREFFNDFQKQEEVLLALIAKGIPKPIANQELNKFISHWTELNKSGTKQRWELEKTFEVPKRFATWWSNYERFNKGGSKKSNVIII